jgi:hypothetical protein
VHWRARVFGPFMPDPHLQNEVDGFKRTVIGAKPAITVLLIGPHATFRRRPSMIGITTGLGNGITKSGGALI